MAYGQKNYNEIQGINGRYRIRDIGCFLTSFCNLRERFGASDDPIALNAAFRDNGIYIDVDDGVRDDLGWGSISQFDPNIVVSRSVTKAIDDRSAGWPNSNNAIVRFYYRSVNSGQLITHFCLVADAAAHTIVDAWDGVVKSSPYGEPSGFAEYEYHQPVPVTPPPAPEPAPAPPPAPEPDYVEITVQAGWGITHVLQAAGYSKEQYENEAEWDRLAALNGSQTRLRLHPNEVVKVYKTALPIAAPADNPTPEPQTAPPASDTAGETVEVKVIPDGFKASHRAEHEDFQAKHDIVVNDLEGKLPPKQILKGQLVHSVDTFDKAGVKYHRVQKWLDTDQWYGIAESDLEPYDDPDLFNIDLSLTKEAKQLFKNLTARQQFVAIFASVIGAIEHIGVALKIKKVRK